MASTIAAKVEGRRITVADYEPPSAGDVNACIVAFEVSGLLSELPSRRVTFATRSACVTVDYADEIPVPQECLAAEGGLWLTVTGYDAEGVEVARTHRMAYPVQVARAGDDEGASPSAPTLDVVSRIDALAKGLDESEGKRAEAFTSAQEERDTAFEASQARNQAAFEESQASNAEAFEAAEKARESAFAGHVDAWGAKVDAEAAKAERVDATLSGTSITVTDRDGNVRTADLKGDKGDPGDPGAQGPQGPKGDPGRDGSDAAVTKAGIEDALGYEPQRKLTAGANVSIAEDGTISAEAGSSASWDAIEGKPDFAKVATSGAYSDLSGKPDVPTVKEDPNGRVYRINAKDIAALCDYDGNTITATYATKAALSGKQDAISDLATIRAGAAKGATALQSETDPTVPAWAKAETKPSYTASEIALSTKTAVTIGADDADSAFRNFFVSIGDKADEDSPTFRGTPKAPTAAAGTNTTQIATCAFVSTAVANAKVTDAHIDALIDAKLGVVENGSY